MLRGRYRYLLIVVILLMAGFALRIVNVMNVPLFWDEARHIVRAQSIAAGIPWEGLQRNKWFYGVVLAAFNPNGIEAPFIARTISVWCGVLSIAATVKLGKMLSSGRVALVAGLMYAIIPVALNNEREALVDPLMVAMTTLATIFAVKLAKKSSGWYAVGLAFTLTIARLTKASMVGYFILPFVAVILFSLFEQPIRIQNWRGLLHDVASDWRAYLRKIVRPTLYAAAAVAFSLAVTGVVYYLARADGWPMDNSHTLTPDNIAWHLFITRSAPVYLAKEAARYVAVHVTAFTPAVLVLSLVGVGAGLMKRGQHNTLYLLVPAYAFSLIPMIAARPADAGQALPTRYFMLDAPAIAVLAAVGLWWLVGWLQKRVSVVKPAVLASALLVLCCLAAVPNLANQLTADSDDGDSFVLGYAHFPAIEGLSEAYQANGEEPLHIYIGDVTSVWVRAHYGPRAAVIQTVRDGRDWPTDEMTALLDAGEVVAVVEPCADGSCCTPLLDQFGERYTARFYCFDVPE